MRKWGVLLYNRILNNRILNNRISIVPSINCFLYKCRRPTEIFKSPFGKYHNNNYFKQESLIHAKTGGQKYEKHNIYIISKYLPKRYIY